MPLRTISCPWPPTFNISDNDKTVAVSRHSRPSTGKCHARDLMTATRELRCSSQIKDKETEGLRFWLLCSRSHSLQKAQLRLRAACVWPRRPGSAVMVPSQGPDERSPRVLSQNLSVCESIQERVCTWAFFLTLSRICNWLSWNTVLQVSSSEQLGLMASDPYGQGC